MIKSSNDETTACELYLGVNRFGRHPDSEFPIEHPTVSVWHCEMVLTAGGVILRDCDSSNGTFVNDEAVKETMLQAGQTVRLGEVEIYVESTDARIAVPKIEREVAAPPMVLPDGTICCRRHPQSPAKFRCSHCHEVLCEACVHRMRRKGGKELVLCGLCSHSTEFIGRAKPQKKFLLKLLTKTIKLPFLRRNRNP